MRTTLNIDDEVLKKACAITGVTEKTSVVRMGLEALILKSACERLARLGGSDKGLKAVTRRRH